MKTIAALLSFFTILITFSSCKSDQQKKAELITKNYVKFVDSIASQETTNITKNWNEISKDFEEKSKELNTEIDKLEDITIFDDKINPATEKYEALSNLAFQKKTENRQMFNANK
ncbi:hypothetical protein LNP27_08835 [Flavobacterium galactosidilyticum]|uniref:hypothetical protein n=1 Tax=Flavobacterium galactosidilyticum TaxID=2893886 RepID=UPI001E47B526|nr:hypothetical protein [Flavobacterium sp. F-340]UFH45241.1 hypothetical protein LNP27_08835 [Flavobacterium sp. F-340]